VEYLGLFGSYARGDFSEDSDVDLLVRFSKPKSLLTLVRIEREFAERCFQQIEGFGEYGFPESHAASFAHLVYVSSWLKLHYPAIFAAALLNSQPMGFYAPAQIVRDAREHGVEVRAPDVNFSSWDSTLEGNGTYPVLRLGLREVDGLKKTDAQLVKPTENITALHRSGLPVSALEKLSSADAFRSVGLDRRQALWEVKALAKAKPLPLFEYADARDQGAEEKVHLPEMPLSEHVVHDYQTLKLSLKAHPLSFLRERCDAERVTDNAKLKYVKNNALVSVAGLVLVRQRPGSAKGVVFLTLEDEFSVCNVVIWPQVLETYRSTVMGARLMLIRGRVQKSNDVLHVVANRVEDKTAWLGLLTEDSHIMPNALARADEVVKPGPDVPPPTARHPRSVRIIPKSRDFH
jgi:error-prone DNA polymerase